MVVIFMEVLLGRCDFYTIPYILHLLSESTMTISACLFGKDFRWQGGAKETDQYFGLHQLGIVKNNLCKFVDNTQEEKKN